NENTNTQTIYLQQTQEGNAFVLPIAIDFYNGNKIERRKTWMTDKADTLSYKLTRKPNLVNVDADKVLITKKTDNKPLAE
ncbi:hypothetical protein ACSTK3_23545, partial [Vibrio parahaemolyticus]